MDRANQMRTTSRSFLHALRPLIRVRTHTGRIEVFIGSEVRLFGLRAHTSLMAHLSILRQSCLVVLRNRLLLLLLLMRGLLLFLSSVETGRCTSSTAGAAGVGHLTLADRLVVELAQSVPIRLEPVLTCLALVVTAALLLVAFGLERARRLAENVNSSVEKARL